MKTIHESAKRVIFIASLFLSFTTTASAQEAGTPAWLNVVIIQVKGGTGPDFRDRIKEMQAARRAAGMPETLVFSIESGHQNEWHFVTPLQSFAGNDNPPQLMEPGEFATWFERLTATVDSVRSFYAITYPEHEMQGNQGAAPPQLLLLRTTRVISGKEAEYEDWIANQYMPAFRQSNPLGHTMSRGMFGDSTQNFYHAVPIPNWAALDQPDPVARVLGERRMEQMLDGLDGIVEWSELVIARARFDFMEEQN